MTNEEILKAYIKERCNGEENRYRLNVWWIYWALDYLKEANKNKAVINPEYLRATHVSINDTEPPMFVA